MLVHKLIRAMGMLPETFPELIYIEDPFEVWEEVKKISSMMFRQFDFSPVQTVFNDILKLFDGRYPGYRKCNTFYHDLNHTTDCLLVMARLMHGAVLGGVSLKKEDVTLGLISALMHDTGYIQSVDDVTGSGAKYTLIHIDRSIEFLEKYFLDHGYPEEDLTACANFLRCTGLDVKIDEIQFRSREHEIIGKILGTADLIGQMSDKNYLNKLPFLYQEFKEGGVTGFNDELDLFRKTPYFWELVKRRFANELGQVDLYLRAHFRVRWGLDQDLYRKAIEKNLERLQVFLDKRKGNYLKYRGREDLMGMIFG
jgi:hypothetical protein